jgi:hypothetical protein
MATVTNPYLFDGSGSASLDPGVTLALDIFTNTGFARSDTKLMFVSVAVAPGARHSGCLIDHQAKRTDTNCFSGWPGKSELNRSRGGAPRFHVSLE